MKSYEYEKLKILQRNINSKDSKLYFYIREFSKKCGFINKGVIAGFC